MKLILYACAVSLLISRCSQPLKHDAAALTNNASGAPQKVFSANVNDTFSVFVSTPVEFVQGSRKVYPVVYMPDANLYFDIFAAAFRKYEETGMLPPVILVGIGYRDFQVMDSLRSRDLTFPEAIPEYEMDISGKADKFLSFIQNELIPRIDSAYPVNKKKRVLAGHSLGGYFTLFAQHARDSFFSGYIAASPSTHYNHNYIVQALDKSRVAKLSSARSYITFGGLEDEENDEPGMLKSGEILASLERSLGGRASHKSVVFSNLGHMDTPFPSFINGLQWILQEDSTAHGSVK